MNFMTINTSINNISIKSISDPNPGMDWLVIDDVTAAYSRHFMPLCLLSRRLRKARSRPMQLEPISEIPQ